MRKLVPILLLALGACSPAQEKAWWSWFHQDPSAAIHYATNDCGELCTNDTNHNGVVEPDRTSDQSSSSSDAAAPSSDSSSSTGDGDVPDEVYSGALPGMAKCGQWADEAWAAGWRSDGYTLGRIMYAESRCDPGAYNGQSHFGGHATGLMQIIWPTWAVECGNINIWDPVSNLRCAKYLRDTYGWGQWSTY